MIEAPDRPEYVYKFQGNKDYSLQNLKAHAIYYSSVKKFNDPYDCDILPNIVQPTPAELALIKEHAQQNKELPDIARKEILEYSGDDLGVRLLEGMQKIINDQLEKSRGNLGVACFSSRNDDLLMWAHYGDRFKGYCLELSTRAGMLSNLLPVQYVDAIPSYSLHSLIVNEPSSIGISKLFLSKAKSWQYEHEWRSFCEQPDRMISYDPKDLVGIYLGPEIEEKSMAEIMQIAEDVYTSLKVYKGKRSRTEFKVEFNQIR